MNIVINAVLSYEQPRGVGRYINNLLPALAEIDHENQYYVYYGKWMKDYEFLKIDQDNFHFVELSIRNTMLARNLYLAILLPFYCKKYHPDVFFLIDTQAILFNPCKMVSTIHDLAEYVIPEKYDSKQAFIRRRIVKHQAKISDRIITVSQYSRRDICTRFRIPESKVSVVYNSVNHPGCIQIEKPENYLLYVSEIERAKNLITLIKAYSMLPKEIMDQFELYVVGKKGNDYEGIISLINRKEIQGRVKFFGFVSDEELSELYSRAYCFVFPSLFEGFGLPVLEAMARGTPVICSNTSSIPEVGGDAVLTFDPYNEKDIAEQIIRIVNEPDLRYRMIQKGIQRAALFSKESAARATLDVLTSL